MALRIPIFVWKPDDTPSRDLAKLKPEPGQYEVYLNAPPFVREFQNQPNREFRIGEWRNTLQEVRLFRRGEDRVLLVVLRLRRDAPEGPQQASPVAIGALVAGGLAVLALGAGFLVIREIRRTFETTGGQIALAAGAVIALRFAFRRGGPIAKPS